MSGGDARAHSRADQQESRLKDPRGGWKTDAVRRIERRNCVWAFFIDAIPLYGLYALLFTSKGMSQAAISGLFVVWSVVALISEVPAGAVADRVSRRALLAAASVLQGAGFATWVLWPGPPAFVAGFVLWGIGAACISGTQQALIYDALAEVGQASEYARVRGRVVAVGLAGQIPAALIAGPLYSWGGYGAVGAISVAGSVAAAVAALRIPEGRRGTGDGDSDMGYIGLLVAGVREAAHSSLIRGALVASGMLVSLEALEEYDVLLAHQWGVPTVWVPVAVLWLPFLGALGAAAAGRLSGASPRTLAAALGAGVALLAVAGAVQVPLGIAAIGAYYGIFRAVRVVIDMRLQERIVGPSRATVTSAAEFLGGVVGIGAFGLWALWGLWGMLGLAVVVVGVVALSPTRRGGAPLASRP